MASASSPSRPSRNEGTGRARGPRALIVTIYGLYAREAGGWLGVGSLIRLLAGLGVEDQSVRSAISRLKRRGMLVPQKVDGTAGYALSDRAREILREGDRRIFERPGARPGGGGGHGPIEGWVLAVFTVPETERDQRHQLRSRLTWLGFGTVAPGVWIAPAHVHDEAVDVLRRAGLDGYVDLFRAEHTGFGPLRSQVAAWWDLDELERMYDEFVVRFEPVLRRAGRRRRADDAAAFAEYVQVLTEWRRLPYLDPGLPAELLPRKWRGHRAAEVFFALRDRLAEPAHRHVVAVTGQSRSGRTA